MSKIKSRKHPVSGMGLVMAALPGIVLAAQSQPATTERTLGSVSVQEEVEEGGYKRDRASSPKFTAPLADLPQTITVIPKELLADQGVGTLAEALRNTPGITFTLGENGNSTAGDSITMRGFDTANSIFLDGIRDLGAVARDTFNIEQVEVVKGPSGSDNGRSSPTGYINQQTKVPTLEALTDATLALGTDSRLRVTGDWNHALAAIDGAAMRFNVMYEKADRPGRDVVDSRRWAVAPSFALGLGGDTRAFFSYLHLQQDNTPDGGLPTIGLPGYSSGNADAAIAAAVNAARPVDERNYYGSLSDFEDVVANMFTVRLEHDLSEITSLRNTSRYGRYTLERDITGVNAVGHLTLATAGNPAVWTLARSRQYRNETNEILTNQTNLTTVFATGAVGHSLSTGVEFIYERADTQGATATGTTTAANLYNPRTSDSFAVMLPNGSVTDGKTVTAAAYVFDTLQFSERWSLNLGLRLDHYQTETTAVPAAATPPVAATFLEDQGNLVTGKAGLVFKPLPNGSVYINYANSEQPPGGANFTLSASTSATNVARPNLDPQKATNLEIGTKWELFENRLVLTAAAFDTRNRNDLTNTDPVTGEITQLGERKVRGVEFGASGMITPNWQLTAGLASMATEVTEGSATTTGAQLPFSPELTFTSWTSYKLPFGLTIGGGARFTDTQYRNGGNTQATVTNLAEIPSYWVVDAMAGYALNERMTLQFNAYNLFDEFYAASVNNSGLRYVLGAPRSFQLSATFSFR